MAKIQEWGAQVVKSEFLRQNAIFFVGSLAVSVINYAYYPVLSRLLDIRAYGEVQVLISLFLQLTIFLTVLGQVTVTIAAQTGAKAGKSQLFELEKFALLTSAVLFMAGTIGAWYLRELLHFDSVWPFIILLLAFVLAVPLTSRSSYLRGRKAFGTVSKTNILAAAGKLGASAALVAAGFGTAGAIGGLVAAQIVALAYAAAKARQLGLQRPEGARLFSWPDVKAIVPELKFSLFVLVISLAVTILSSIDVFMVKHYFDPHTAGLYAGISTVAKIIFFLTASVAQVMLPSVNHALPTRQNRLLLIKSFILVTLLGGGAAFVFALAPGLIAGTLMGQSYTAYAHLLPNLALAMFAISIINLLVTYYMALRRHQISIVVGLGIILTIGLLIANHHSLDAVVASLLTGSISMLGIFALWRGLWQLQTGGTRV